MNLKKTIAPLIFANILICHFSWAAAPKFELHDILALPSENQQVVAKQYGTDLITDLRSVIHDPQKPMSLRWKALVFLSTNHPQESVPDLNKSLLSSDWYMRNAALIGLSLVEKKLAINAAKNLIKDKALVVRSAAVDIIAKSLDADLRDLFWQELFKSYNYRGDQSLWIRGQIVKSLSAEPRSHETRIFSRLIKEKDPAVQTFAISALEKLQGTKLGQEKSPLSQKVSLWENYLKKMDL